MLLMLALWSCGRRAGVVQAQRQIHRAFVWPEQIRWGGRGQLWAAFFGSRLPAARTCLVSSLGLVVARLSGLWWGPAAPGCLTIEPHRLVPGDYLVRTALKLA